jgi:hypothetical protein
MFVIAVADEHGPIAPRLVCRLHDKAADNRIEPGMPSIDIA